MKYARKVMILLTVLGYSSLALANENYRYECHSKQNTNTIEVDYLLREKPLPCEIKYFQNSTEETLWYAHYTQGYCEAKANELAENLKAKGWQCKRIPNPEIK
ncbi:MAG: hypothetical protein PUP46_00780 [Endozoicomonas sp. (ex Botrylloides leachii)]|nr:hypothetical protein [Endozoicomonas sp. (ex Botrylloides leachii)]